MRGVSQHNLFGICFIESEKKKHSGNTISHFSLVEEIVAAACFSFSGSSSKLQPSVGCVPLRSAVGKLVPCGQVQCTVI